MPLDTHKPTYIHDAFISYSRIDKEFARKLDKALKNYKPPKDLRVPQRNLNVFRDEEDFTGVEYHESVARHLKDSAKLIVLCSPNSRKSEYVNDEIRQFAETSGADNIIPILVSGIPNNEAKPGQEDEMAFPETLSSAMEMPLAADYRNFDLKKDKVNKRIFYGPWYTTLANIYSISRNEIEQREKKREARTRRIRRGIVSGVITVLLVAFVVTLFFWRQAVEQRNIAVARQLVAQADLTRSQRADLLPRSVLIAVEGLKIFPSFETDQALRQGLALLPQHIKLFTHEEDIKVAAFSPGGKFLATARWDKPAQVWDVATGQAIVTLPYDGVVELAVFSADGKFLAIAGDGSAQVWETSNWRPVADPINKIGGPTAVTFSPDGKFLAISARDQTARVWEVSSNKLVRTFNHGDNNLNLSGDMDAVVFSPDGKHLVTSWRHEIQMWELTTGNKTGLTMEHNGRVNAIAFSPDGTFLTSAGESSTVRVSDVISGQEVSNLPHLATVTAVVFSKDGEYLATASEDKTVKVWKQDISQTVRAGARLEPRPMAVVANITHEAPITAIIFSPDGKYLATASQDNTARVWEANGGREVARVVYEKEVLAIAFSADGSSIAAVSSDNTAGVWKVATGPEVARISHANNITDVRFSLDGLYLSTASEDKTAGIWEAATGHVFRKPGEGSAHSVALGPLGGLLAAATGDTVMVWEVGSDKEIARIDHKTPLDWEEIERRRAARGESYRVVRPEIDRMKREGSVEIVAFSPDERYLVTMRADEIARVWEVRSRREIVSIQYNGHPITVALSSTGKFLAVGFHPDWKSTTEVKDDNTVQVWELPSGKKVGNMKHGPKLGAMVFSPDGRYLVTTSNDKFARVWEVPGTKEIAHMEHRAFINDSVVVSPDGRYLITASVDSIVHVWEMNNGREGATINHKGAVNSIALSPDGEWMATADDDTARVWNMNKRQEVARLSHGDRVRIVAFSKNGKLLATGGNDNTSRVWEVSSGQEVSRMKHRDAVYAVAFSPDDKYLATASSDNTGRVSLLRPQDLITEACSRLTRNLTEEEWKQYLPDEPYRRTCPNWPIPKE